MYAILQSQFRSGPHAIQGPILWQPLRQVDVCPRPFWDHQPTSPACRWTCRSRSRCRGMVGGSRLQAFQDLVRVHLSHTVPLDSPDQQPEAFTQVPGCLAPFSSQQGLVGTVASILLASHHLFELRSAAIHRTHYCHSAAHEAGLWVSPLPRSPLLQLTLGSSSRAISYICASRLFGGFGATALIRSAWGRHDWWWTNSKTTAMCKAARGCWQVEGKLQMLSTHSPDEAFLTRHGSLQTVGWGLHRPTTDLSIARRGGTGVKYTWAQAGRIRAVFPRHICICARVGLGPIPL